MTYVRFDEHKFSLEPPDEYSELMDKFPFEKELVEKTWYLDKPVSMTYRQKNSEFIELADEIFHTYVEDERDPINGKFAVYFTRLPELAEVTANLDTAARGVMFGFPNRDVASFIARDDPSDISCNRKS